MTNNETPKENHKCFGVNWKTATIGDIEKIDVKTEDENKDTPLHWAARLSPPDIVRHLVLSMDADVKAQNKLKFTPLHEGAAESNNPETIRILIDVWADVNEREFWLDLSPLHLAARWNKNPEIISVLIEKGADVNALDEVDRTPLHIAAFHNTPEIVSALVKIETKINAQDKHKRTPLHYAALSDSSKIVELLLSYKNCDRTIKDEDGNIAADYMRRNRKLRGTPAFVKLTNLSYD